MHKDICLSDLIQSTLESFYKLMRELSDESYSIAKQERYVFDDYLSYCGIQRCKQLVFCKNVAFGESIHQGTLTYVCISYKRNTH